MRPWTRCLAACGVLGLSGPAGAVGPAADAPGPPTVADTVIIEDFEGERPGTPPRQWRTSDGRRLLPLTERFVRSRERFVVLGGAGGRFVRAHTEDESVKIILPFGRGRNWRLQQRPRLAWEWRAVLLPDGAREDRPGRNDAGGAVSVVFGRDRLGRLRSLKYTYSTTLPAETVVEFGALRVLVASSATDTSGSWVRVERHVVDDYRRAFGQPPPGDPAAIVLWSDSDSTGGTSEVDFDNLALLPPPSPHP